MPFDLLIKTRRFMLLRESILDVSFYELCLFHFFKFCSRHFFSFITKTAITTLFDFEKVVNLHLLYFRNQIKSNPRIKRNKAYIKFDCISPAYCRSRTAQSVAYRASENKRSLVRSAVW